MMPAARRHEPIALFHPLRGLPRGLVGTPGSMEHRWHLRALRAPGSDLFCFQNTNEIPIDTRRRMTKLAGTLTHSPAIRRSNGHIIIRFDHCSFNFRWALKDVCLTCLEGLALPRRRSCLPFLRLFPPRSPQPQAEDAVRITNHTVKTGELLTFSIEISTSQSRARVKLVGNASLT